MNAQLQALVARAQAAHVAVSARGAKPPAAAAAAAPPAASAAARPAKRPRSDGAARPSADERRQFMSGAASRVHAPASARAAAGAAGAGRGAADGDEREFAQLARSVERLGESRLEGLAKKDQRARLRGQLGLKPEKRQKMPYKLLVARRTKERAQDAAAAELARQAGMAPRRAPGQGGGGGGGGGRGGGAGSRGGWLAAEKTPSLGGALRGGVLHVTSSTIKSVNYSTKQRGGGGKGGKGGRGRGGGGGRGRGRKR
jgi:hypothetical protein